MRSEEEGQATLELALCIPFLLMLVMLMVQMGALALCSQAVTSAAREAARTASIEGPEKAAVTARTATGLDPQRLDVHFRLSGDLVTAEVRYTARITFPFTSRTLLRPEVTRTATMWSESRQSVWARG